MSIPADHHLVAGDIITVTAVVDIRSERGDVIYARVGSAYGAPVRIDRDNATLIRTHLVVGDRVRHADSPSAPGMEWAPGTIAAIVGDQAWVSWEEGRQMILELGALRRICTVTVAGA